jgi:endo-1,4-beta-xylanase
MPGRSASRSRKPSFDRFGPAPGGTTLAQGLGMQAKIPCLAWGMLLALASGLGAQEPSLAAAYERYFPIGAAVDPETLGGLGGLLARQVSSLTAENDMKWERLHPLPGNEPKAYDFSRADRIVRFAAERGMKVRGHTLVWHRQVPGWVFRGLDGSPAPRELVLERLREHIAAVLAHFRGKVYCWDVVNEALADGARGWRQDSPWQAAAGQDEDGDGLPDYLVQAFQQARAADPQALLFYNDYGIEAGPKHAKAFSLARSLKARGLLDGVGIQGHWSIHDLNPEGVGWAIRRFASLGLQVHLTELDLSVYRWGDQSSLPELPAELAQRQARRYGELFAVLREQAGPNGLTAVTFWGLADDHTWLDEFPVRGRKDWPLPFDAEHRPKQAFWAIVQW